MANTEDKQEFYTSPKVKVVEIKARQVICQSDSNLQYGGFSSGEQEGN